MHNENYQTATVAEIRQMGGDVDDAVVDGIVKTGASAAEVLHPLQWFCGGGGLEDESGHGPDGTVKAVREILQAGGQPDEPWPEPQTAP
jgi:hypothetical protein